MRRFAVFLAVGLLPIFAANSRAADSSFTVEAAIEAGLTHNTQIRLAQARLREVYGNVTWRKADLYPVFKMGGVLIPPTVVFGGAIPIYSAKMAPSLRASRLAVSAAQTNIRLAMLDFVYKVRLAYIDAQIAEKQIYAEQQNDSAFQELVRQVQALNTAGQKGEFDVAATSVDAGTAKLRVERARFEAERKRLDLLELIGIQPGHPLFSTPLPSDFPRVELPSGTLEELQQMAIAQRVDLQLLKTILLTDDQQVLIAYASYFPEVGILSYNRIEARAPGFLDSLLESSDPTRNSAQIEDNPFGQSVSKQFLQLSWRVFDGFNTHGQVVLREASRARRKVLVEALEKRVGFQVMQALEARTGASALQAAIEKHAGDNPLKNAREKLEAGFLSRLAFADIVVQQSRFDFERDEVRYELAKASVALQRALGLGVEFPAEDPPPKP